MDKRALRKAVRLAFPGKEARDAQSAAICRHVLANDAYRRAAVVGGYMPMAHEADVTPILLDALAGGKVLALPRCARPPEMTFHRVQSLQELIPGAYGLPEPSADAPVIPTGEIELLLVPLEAIDRRGMRLGKGGGYYDRLLEDAGPVTLGMALAWQWVEQVPADSWDKALQGAADAEGIRWWNGNNDRERIE